MIVFTGVRMMPGDPARVMAGTDADAAGIEEVREKYGLNDPIPFQYVRWARPPGRPRPLHSNTRGGRQDGGGEVTDHVQGARALGAGDLRLMSRHVLPNIASSLLVQATISVPIAIIAEAVLSFLGLGVQPPAPS